MSKSPNSAKRSPRAAYVPEKFNPDFVAYVKIPLPPEFEDRDKTAEITDIARGFIHLVHLGYRVSLEVRPDGMVQASMYGLNTEGHEDDGIGTSCVAARETSAVVGLVMKFEAATALNIWAARPPDKSKSAW